MPEVLKDINKDIFELTMIIALEINFLNKWDLLPQAMKILSNTSAV